MGEYVIDASIAIKWVVKNEPFRHKARQLLNDATIKGATLIGPPLLEYEVESNLQRRLQLRRATIGATDASLQAFYTVGVQVFSYPNMVRRAREIARQFGQERIYDSIYAALAEIRSCDFWTADKQFYDAVKSDLTFVKYLADYP